MLEADGKAEYVDHAEDDADAGASLSWMAAALEALRALGYSAVEAEAAVAVARRGCADGYPTTEDLVRAALREFVTSREGPVTFDEIASAVESQFGVDSFESDILEPVPEDLRVVLKLLLGLF